MSFWILVPRTLKRALISLSIGGFLVLISDKAVAFWRARHNSKGAIVYEFALYEKKLRSPAIAGKAQTEIAIPGSQVVEFHRHKIVCEFIRARRESQWKDERQRMLNTEQKMVPTQLPVTRYQCGLFPIFHRAGIGWGLF
jgi:hypothetical protein